MLNFRNAVDAVVGAFVPSAETLAGRLADAQYADKVERVKELATARLAQFAALDALLDQVAETLRKTDELAVEIAVASPVPWRRADEPARLQSALLHKLQASGALPGSASLEGAAPPRLAALADSGHSVLVQEIERRRPHQN